MAAAASPQFDVVIVGTGFSGLGMAIALLKDGRTNFTVLERAEDVGGTWRDNRYPGCACDIPSYRRRTRKVDAGAYDFTA